MSARYRRAIRRPLPCTLDPADVMGVLRRDAHPFALAGAWADGRAVLGSEPVAQAGPPEPLERVFGPRGMPVPIRPHALPAAGSDISATRWPDIRSARRTVRPGTSRRSQRPTGKRPCRTDMKNCPGAWRPARRRRPAIGAASSLSCPDPPRTADGLPMAIRHRTDPVDGVQFHPESILTRAGAQLIANFVRRAADLRQRKLC